MSICTALAASERGTQILKQFPELIVGRLNSRLSVKLNIK